MDYLDLYICIVLVFFKITGVDMQNILVRPRNTAALANSEVELRCGFETTPTPVVKWSEFILNPTTGNIISSNGVNNPNYPDEDRLRRYNTTNPSPGQYNLKINPLTREDAGYYACVGDQFDNKYGAYVVFLEPVTCNAELNGNVVATLIEGEEFVLVCERPYKSHPGWPPVLNWEGETNENRTDADKARVEVLKTALESRTPITYRCRTSFTDPPAFRPPTEKNTYDDTIKPDYTEACQTTIQVHWPAKNIRRDPDLETYQPGNSVTCLASVNPEPATFRWVKLSGNGPQEKVGADLPITEAMVGESEYECIVTNKVRGIDTNNSRNFTFIVTPTPTTVIPTTWTPVQTTTPLVTGPGVTRGGLSGGAIAGIVIGCLVGVAVIIALIICCLMRSKKEEDTKPMSLQKTQKAGNGVDQVRGGPYMHTDLAYTNNTDNRSPTGTGPPPYDPRYPNQPEGGIHYADLSFNSTVDDTPRSRKPIQMSDPGNATVYADIRRV